MAIAFGVGTGKTNTAAPGRTGNGPLTATLPANWVPGDLAIIILYSDQGSGSVPSTWHEITGSPFGAGTEKLQIFWKFLGETESDPVTTISGSGTNISHCANVVTYSGVNPTTPISVIGTPSNGTGTPMTAGAITTTSGDQMVLGCCGRGDNEDASGQTFGGSATGVSEQLDGGTNAGNDSQVSMYEKLIAVSGTSSGNGSADTSATDPWVSVLIALKAAPSAVSIDLNGDIEIIARPTIALDGDIKIVSRATIALDGDVKLVARPTIALDGDLELIARPTIALDGDAIVVSRQTVALDGDVVLTARVTISADGDIVIGGYWHALPSLLALWDARQIGMGTQPSDGDPISEWVDHSGNAFHGEAPNALDKPSFAELGMLKAPGIRFNADSSFEEDFLVSNFGPLSNAFTIFCVWISKVDLDGPGFAYCFGDGLDRNVIWLQDSASTFYIRDVITEYRDAWNFGSPPESEWGKRETVIVTAHRFKDNADPAVQHLQHVLWVNGHKLLDSPAERDSQASEGPNIAGWQENLVIGAYETVTGWGHLRGLVGFLAWYDEELDDSTVALAVEKLMQEFTNRVFVDGDIVVASRIELALDGDIIIVARAAVDLDGDAIVVARASVDLDGDISIVANVNISVDGDMWLKEPMILRVTPPSTLQHGWIRSDEVDAGILLGVGSEDLSGELPGEVAPTFNDNTYIKLEITEGNMGILGEIATLPYEINIPTNEKRGTVAGIRMWFRSGTLLQTDPADYAAVMFNWNNGWLALTRPEGWNSEWFDLTPWDAYPNHNWYLDIYRKGPEPYGYFTWTEVLFSGGGQYPPANIRLIATVLGGPASGTRNVRIYAVWVQPMRFQDLYPEQFDNPTNPRLFVWVLELGGDIFIDWKKVTVDGDIFLINQVAIQVSGDIEIATSGGTVQVTITAAGDILLVNRVSLDLAGDLKAVSRIGIDVLGDLIAVSRVEIALAGDAIIVARTTINLAGDIKNIGQISIQVVGDVVITKRVEINLAGSIVVVARLYVESAGDIAIANRIEITLAGNTIVVRRTQIVLAGDIMVITVGLMLTVGCPVVTLEEANIVVTDASDNIVVSETETISVVLIEDSIVVAVEDEITVTLEDPNLTVEACQT